MAAPAAVEEGRLEDDVRAGLHRSHGLGVGLPQLGGRLRGTTGHLDDRPSSGPELVDVVALVIEAATADQVELGIIAERFLDRAGGAQQLERDEVVALEEADEIRGADDQRPVDQLHGPTLAAVRVRSPVTSGTIRPVTDRDPAPSEPVSAGAREAHRPPDPRGDERGQVRRPAAPGREAAARRGLRRG